MLDFDRTLPAMIKGYAWLPDLRRRHGGAPVPLRFGGRRAIAVGGPEAAAFFYADGNLERRDALPGRVLDTLIGRGGVHTLDGEAHRVRKALLTHLLMAGDGVAALTKLTGEAFDEAADGWSGGPAVEVLGASARVISDAVTRWTGVPEEERAPDLLAMVDGFAAAGPRQARARLARRRQERRLAEFIDHVRREDPSTVPVSQIAHHLEDGYLLESRTAAVELLNVLRPATAVAHLVAFAAHALDRFPSVRGGLRDGDRDYVAAFVNEVRRFYPFTPFVGGVACRDLTVQHVTIARGTLVLLDVYGQHHDARVWPEPYTFRPERFLDHPPGPYEMIPQGGGDPRTGHRCPGEQITVALLGMFAQRLARLDHYLPPQDTSIDITRVPARPRSGMRIIVP